MHCWKVEVSNKEVTFNHQSGTKVDPRHINHEHIIMGAYVNHSHHTDVLLVVMGSIEPRTVKLNIDINRRVYLTVVILGERTACTFDGGPHCHDEWYVKTCKTTKFYVDNDCSSSSDECDNCDRHKRRHDCDDCNNHRHSHHHHHNHYNYPICGNNVLNYHGYDDCDCHSHKRHHKRHHKCKDKCKEKKFCIGNWTIILE
jgi:hypothetical protein